jgi:hypothetical protein
MLSLPMARATASHLARLREAITISLNTSGFCAHLWAHTVPTPPQPMIMTLLMFQAFLDDLWAKILILLYQNK